jgi:hypothetical protein
MLKQDASPKGLYRSHAAGLLVAAGGAAAWSRVSGRGTGDATPTLGGGSATGGLANASGGGGGGAAGASGVASNAFALAVLGSGETCAFGVGAGAGVGVGAGTTRADRGRISTVVTVVRGGGTRSSSATESIGAAAGGCGDSGRFVPSAAGAAERVPATVGSAGTIGGPALTPV